MSERDSSWPREETRLNRLNLGAQDDVSPGARNQWPLPPREGPTGGNSQDAAQRGDAMGGRCALTNSKSLDGIEPVSLTTPRPPLFSNLPFFAESLVLPPQPAELLPVVGRQAVRPLARIAICLGQPVADGLGRRLELLGQ